MFSAVRFLGLAAAALSVGASAAQGQTDYRNLDEGRPVATEDAYPVERYGFELLAPYRFDADRGGTRVYLVAPELEYGILRNAQVGMQTLFAVADRPGGTDWGFAGMRVSGLYNFNTESAGLPALALRTDAFLPFGKLAGDAVRFSIKGVATRSWGSTRAHLNAGVGLGSDNAEAVELPSRWALSAAVDHTFIRRSLLVVMEVLTERPLRGAPIYVTASAGIRWQWLPTLVLDGGVTRRLGSHGPDVALTIGLSQAFAIAGLMPGGSP
jgi:hypothetical protein